MSKSSSGLFSRTKGARKIINYSNQNREEGINKAVKLASKKYLYDNDTGLFGEKGDNVRIIKSNNPDNDAADFYKIIKMDGVEEKLGNNKGVRTRLSDNTIIVYREMTKTPNSPAVEINIRKLTSDTKVRNQKIHFIKEK